MKGKYATLAAQEWCVPHSNQEHAHDFKRATSNFYETKLPNVNMIQFLFCGRQLLSSYITTLQSPEAQKQIEPQDKDP